MDTNCTPLVAGVFLFCYEGDLIMSHSVNNQVDVMKRSTLFQDI